MIKKIKSAGAFLAHAPLPARVSMVIMGGGQLINRQITKGIIYLLVLAAAIYYYVTTGINDIKGIFTLGTEEADPWTGTVGDDSIKMLISGLLSVILLIVLIIIYVANVKDANKTSKLIKSGKKPLSFRKELADFTDRKFYIAALILPITGVVVFSVIPILFMMLLAFTDYGGDVVYPKLVDWIGFDNFKTILSLSNVASTFKKIFAWNILWAVASTFITYFAGLFLALLLNKKCVKGKKFWRAFPILAYAIPGFITLIGFKFMFSYGGPINYYIKEIFHERPIGFLDIDAHWTARIIGLLVNTWISVPTSMLLATSVLSNINGELYEAASIDGANKWKQFTKLTLPFVIFSTTPNLITSFIGNFNNFGVFFFLRPGLNLDGYFCASDTDLLINWMYNLSIDNTYYSIGAAISLIIFIFTSIFSLVVYINSNAYKKEDMFR